MYGKHPFFGNEAPSSPTPTSKDMDSSKAISFYKSALGNQQAFYNMPKEKALKVIEQMDVLEINGCIEAHTKSIALYETSKKAAESYFENPTVEVMYRLTKDSLSANAGTLNQLQALSAQLGVDNLVNFRPPVIADYEDMKEIISLTSQLITKIKQVLPLFETARDEKLSKKDYGMN